jgi:hypothetical protein
VVFGDRIDVAPLQLAMTAGGIAALVAGVILVARAPALSQLHTPPLHVPHPAMPGFVHRVTGPQPALGMGPGQHGADDSGPPDPSGSEGPDDEASKVQTG